MDATSESRPADGLEAWDIRPVGPEDVGLLLDLIRELAEFEKLLDQLETDHATMTWSLFERRCAEALLFFVDGRPAGYCVFFESFSTFIGRPGLYVEDVYIRPAYRRQGFGRRVFGYLGRLARARGCRRIDLQVLDWNQPAVALYESLGAERQSQWLNYRFAGAALDRLAESE
jgi:ribosomal protein S18 acetylase RimI-like enzyme